MYIYIYIYININKMSPLYLIRDDSVSMICFQSTDPICYVITHLTYVIVFT